MAGIRTRSRFGHDRRVVSELTGPNPTDPNQGRSPAKRGPLISLAEGDFVYIRNEGDGAEELFNEREDPRNYAIRPRSRPCNPSCIAFANVLSVPSETVIAKSELYIVVNKTQARLPAGRDRPVLPCCC